MPVAQASGGDGEVQNIVIVGSGPAGYTAAIYAGRANLRPVVLEGVAAGAPGGQLMTTTDVENYPGFPQGISGPALMGNMRAQAERWGAQLVTDDAVSLELSSAPYVVRTRESGSFASHAVIIATGASAKRLGVPGEHALWSRGISSCAICDGAAPIFQGVPLAVVGGGDSACEEAVYLAKFATEVHLLVRSDHLRASRTMQDRVLAHPRVTVHFDTRVVEALGAAEGAGGSPLRGLRVRSGDSRQEWELAVRGMFYAIGHTPNTEFLLAGGSAGGGERHVKLHAVSGNVLTKTPGAPATHVDGVFAAGDVADDEWRQAVTAAGSGCMAAIAAERWLAENGLILDAELPPPPVRAPATTVSVPDSGGQMSGAERAAESALADDKESYDVENTWHRGQYALRKLYHESKRPIVVKYISPGCGPCGQLKPILHSVVREMEAEVHFCEIDITVDPEIAEAAGVTGSPTVHIFHEKSLVQAFRGVKMKSEYRRVMRGLLKESGAEVSN